MALDPIEADLLDQIALDPRGWARDVLADHWMGGPDEPRGMLLHRSYPQHRRIEIMERYGKQWTSLLRGAGFPERSLDLRTGFLEYPVSLAAQDPLIGADDLFRVSPLMYQEHACADGGASRIYDGVQLTPLGERTRVAIKAPIVPRLQEQVDREYAIARTLHHPNIVHVVGRAIRRNGVANVYQWGGRALDRTVATLGSVGRGFDEATAISIALQGCDALAAAHGRAVIHGQVALNHLLVSATGVITLIDFLHARADLSGWPPLENYLYDSGPGIIKVNKAALSAISPERVHGLEYDHRTDLYSLGFVMGELLAGRSLIESTSDFGILEAAANGILAIPACSPPLLRILRRTLAPVEHRYASAADLRGDLEYAARELGLEVGPRVITASMRGLDRLAAAVTS